MLIIKLLVMCLYTKCVRARVCRKSLVTVFMELVLKANELKNAKKLAMMFGLNGQHLLEYAGDVFLSNKEFPRAVASYKMSKVRGGSIDTL